MFSRFRNARVVCNSLFNFNPPSKSGFRSSLVRKRAHISPTPKAIIHLPLLPRFIQHPQLISSLAKGGTPNFSDLFLNRLKTAVSNELILPIPAELKANPCIAYAVIYVDGRLVKGSKKDVIVSAVGRTPDGRVIFAKTCVVDCCVLIPIYRSLSFDMVMAEHTAFIYGNLAAIEYEIASFDIVTDNTSVKLNLAKENNIYKQDSHYFLSISGKKIWSDSNAPGFGKVAWVSTTDNYVADLLTRFDVSKIPQFYSLIRYDLSHFETTTKALFANTTVCSLVVEGDNFKNHVNHVISII